MQTWGSYTIRLLVCCQMKINQVFAWLYLARDGAGRVEPRRQVLFGEFHGFQCGIETLHRSTRLWRLLARLTCCANFNAMLANRRTVGCLQQIFSLDNRSRNGRSMGTGGSTARYEQHDTVVDRLAIPGDFTFDSGTRNLSLTGAAACEHDDRQQT